MRTATAHLRQGVAARMVEHLIEVARARGYRRLSLETGTGAPFEPAHGLYRRFGFEFCEAFGGYESTDFNVFMSRSLD